MLAYQPQYTAYEAKFVSQKHPFHILDASPYPLLVSVFLFTLLVPLTFSLHSMSLS